MSSSSVRDIEMMEIRDDAREQFDKLMDTLREDFESKLRAAEASDKDIQSYKGLTDHERLLVTGQSVMCGIACICRVPVVQWLQDVLEMQNPGFTFEVLLARTRK